MTGRCFAYKVGVIAETFVAKNGPHVDNLYFSYIFKIKNKALSGARKGVLQVCERIPNWNTLHITFQVTRVI